MLSLTKYSSEIYCLKNSNTKFDNHYKQLSDENEQLHNSYNIQQIIYKKQKVEFAQIKQKNNSILSHNNNSEEKNSLSMDICQTNDPNILHLTYNKCNFCKFQYLQIKRTLTSIFQKYGL